MESVQARRRNHRSSATAAAIRLHPSSITSMPVAIDIRKYGETIGKAGKAIARGALVHVHNLEGTRARGDLEGREKR